MATVHTREITKIEVINSGEQDIVSDVMIEWTATNDHESLPRRKFKIDKSFKLNTEEISSSSEGFVAYENLTQEVIEGWLGEEFSSLSSEIESTLSSRFDQMIEFIENPPKPEKITRDRPW